MVFGHQRHLRFLSITAFEVFARGCHLLLFLFIGNQFGAGIATDTVFFLYTPLTIILSVAAGAAQSVIMPGVHRAHVAQCVYPFLRALRQHALYTIAPVSVLITLVVWSVIDHVDLPVLVFLSPIPLLGAWAAIDTGVLNAQDRFQVAVLGPVYGSLFASIVLLLVPVTSEGLALTLLGFELGRAVGLRCHAHPYLRRYRQGQDRDARAVVRWALYGVRLQALGSLLVALNPLVDVLFAQGLGLGAVSNVTYANRLWNMVPMLFTGSLTLVHADWSRKASRGSLVLHHVHASAICFGSMALIGSVIGIYISDGFIELLYGWGKIDASNRQVLSMLLKAYLVGSAPFVAGLAYVRAFSAQGRLSQVAIASGISVVMNSILNWLLVHMYGLFGISLSTSITYAIVALYLSIAFTCSDFGSKKVKIKPGKLQNISGYA